MCEKSFNISVEWPCPICGKIMKDGPTYLKWYPKPSIFTKRCNDCDLCITWFKMDKGVNYTIKHELEEDHA